MSRRARFAIALALLYALSLGFAGAIFAAFWADLASPERDALVAMLVERRSLLAFAGLLLLGALSYLLRALFRRYVEAPLDLAEGVRFIVDGNAGYRVPFDGSGEMRELANAVNVLASRYEGVQRDVSARVAEAQRKVEEERNRLAALISESSQGVLVCNVEGRILLYNERAHRLLAGAAAAGPLVGLGRSVFAILERSAVAHALDGLRAKLERGTPRPLARFVATAPAGELLRVQMAPVTGPDGPSGFVLAIEDVTRALEAGSRSEALLRSFVETSRRAVANLRAAAESLLAYPGMDADRRARFIRVIGEEAEGLSGALDRTSREWAASFRAEWLLDDVAGADLVAIIRRRVEATLAMPVSAGEVDASVWLRADGWAIVSAVGALARRLRDEAGAREIRLSLAAAGRRVHLDVAWSGDPLGPDALAGWEERPLDVGGDGPPVALREVIESHDGEVWHQVNRGAGTGFFRLLLPAAVPEHAPPPPAPAVGPRPEYYDFDLFHQAGQTPELDQRRLADLVLTAFDTETTGLRPSDGDEIFSIGAVRIVNGRILHHESFEQFVDPRRPISPESLRITGIDPALLAGQPTIEQALPRFHRFCEETVLVAHNAAFDLRFLQLKEARAGVSFTHPVLDTLLLAALVLPNLGSIGLEAVAERFGVAVIGRHTALGDAIMTGEIFLKMLPLLAERGIVTLKDAREASKRTFEARVRY